MDNCGICFANDFKEVRILRRAALNCGMLAPGKHVNFRFAARSTMLRMTEEWGWLSGFFLSLRASKMRGNPHLHYPGAISHPAREAQEPPLLSALVGEALEPPVTRCDFAAGYWAAHRPPPTMWYRHPIHNCQLSIVHCPLCQHSMRVSL